VEQEEMMAQIIEWQPWKNAPRDGRWFIALCNDKITTHRVSWGVDRRGEVGWCSADRGSRSFGDGVFAPFGGWIEWPADGHSERAAVSSSPPTSEEKP
jgi:hypothetical protein